MNRWKINVNLWTRCPSIIQMAGCPPPYNSHIRWDAWTSFNIFIESADSHKESDMTEQLSLHWGEEGDLGQDKKNNYSIILNKFLVFQAVLLLLSLFKENGKVKKFSIWWWGKWWWVQLPSAKFSFQNPTICPLPLGLM